MELDELNERRRGRMVVGTDGSPASLAAVRWAAEAAQRTGSWLDVVLVWSPDVDYGWLGAAPVHGWHADPATEGHRLLESVVAEACGHPRPETVRIFLMEGEPAQCLVGHANGADVLVLGDRGRGAFLGLRLGPVASACAMHPTCPVLIVPIGIYGTPRAPIWVACGSSQFSEKAHAQVGAA
jgi:nucleotide-binding universal stress UspA family protein